jgi:putative oxidoreductase
MRSRYSADRLALIYARVALGAAFLNGIAERFGWYGKDVGYGNYANFVKYTAQVNAFMPARTIPFLAAAATVLEAAFGVLLVAGLWPRWTAIGSAVLLAMFGTAMAISLGFWSPLDYSVFSASAAAVLVAVHHPQLEIEQ